MFKGYFQGESTTRRRGEVNEVVNTTKNMKNHCFQMWYIFRANLDYGEEVHQSKNQGIGAI